MQALLEPNLGSWGHPFSHMHLKEHVNATIHARLGRVSENGLLVSNGHNVPWGSILIASHVYSAGTWHKWPGGQCNMQIQNTSYGEIYSCWWKGKPVVVRGTLKFNIWLCDSMNLALPATLCDPHLKVAPSHNAHCHSECCILSYPTLPHLRHLFHTLLWPS